MILFDGTSWAKGNDLENRIRDRWSTLVSDHLESEHVNLAQGGKCNDSILRTTIEYCENNEVDLAIIQFAPINRREILNPNEGVLNPDGNYYYRLNAINNDNPSKSYFKYLNTLEDDVSNFYKNKFLLEYYFKTNNIRHYFVQLNRRNALGNGSKKPCSWQLLSDAKPVTCLYDLLGHDKSASPYYDYPIRGTHPNIEGHRKIADHIIENV